MTPRCMVGRGIALRCVIGRGVTLRCMVGRGITLRCVIGRGIALRCVVGRSVAAGSVTIPGTARTCVPGLLRARPWHVRRTRPRRVPLAGGRSVSRAGVPGLPIPGGCRISAAGGDDLARLVIEPRLHGRVSMLPGLVAPPLIRRGGDLIARIIHAVSVSLCAARDALSGVFPGRRGSGRALPGSGKAAARRSPRAADAVTAGRRARRPRPATGPAALALTTVLPGRYPP